jgi:3'(2'), 5'-bisphosphate nucleotidase
MTASSAFPFTALATPQAMAPQWQQLLTGVEEACEILRGYWEQNRAGKLAPRIKSDGSPVSAADDASNDHLLAVLRTIAPEIPVVSEEEALPQAGWSAPVYWLLDPLDGTRAFLRGEGEFVISLGLVADGRAVAGVIAAPCWKREGSVIGWGVVGQGAWVRDASGKTEPLTARNVAVQQLQDDGVDLLVATRGRTERIDAALHPLRQRHRIACSSALKFLRLAQGEADIYPRYGETQQWDTAGGEALLQAAGGEMYQIDGRPMHYGVDARRGWVNPGFVAAGNGGASALHAAGIRWLKEAEGQRNA